MSETKPSISLTIEQADGSTRVVEFNTRDPIMVGSGASAHVQLLGDEVSSLHCMLKIKGVGQAAVMDLGSDEGTLLNGKEVSVETSLKDGDQLQIGSARLTVHLGGDLLAPTVPIRRVTPGPEIHNETTLRVGPASKGQRKRQDSSSDLVETQEQDLRRSPRAAEQGSTRAAPAPVGLGTGTSGADMARPVEAARSNRGGMKSETLPTKSTNSPSLKQMQLLTPRLNQEEKPQNKGHIDVTMMWGGTVMGVERLTGIGSVKIGEAATNVFQMSHPAIPGSSFEVVTLGSAGAVVHAAQGMELLLNKRLQQGTSIPLDLGQEAVVRVGPVEFVVQYSRRYAGIDLGLFQTLDFMYSKVFALAMIAQLGLVLAMLLTPSFASLEEDSLFKNQNNFTKLILTAQEKRKEEKKQLSGKKGAKHKNEEGLFGKKDKPKEDKLASKKGAPIVDKNKREDDQKIAMDALKAMGLKGPEGAVSNVFGPGGLGTGINNALGGLKGASMGDAGGAGGLGSRGVGSSRVDLQACKLEYSIVSPK